MLANDEISVEIKSATVVNDLGRSKKAAHAAHLAITSFREDSFDRVKRVGIVSKGVSSRCLREVNFCAGIYHRSRVTFPKRGANRARCLAV